MIADNITAERPKIPTEAWEQIARLLPPRQRKSKRGRPRMNDREAMTAILYRLQTGCSWKALPRSLGAASTVYDRFQEWQQAGVFETLGQLGILEQVDLERMQPFLRV